jgi:hypothetical protein
MTQPAATPRHERLAGVGATAPPAATCVLFLVARVEPEATLATWLAPAIALEAIVVHAGVVLGIAMLAWPGTLRGHVVYWTLLGAMAAIYVLAAFDVGGGATTLQFLLLALVTYGGVLWAPARRRIDVGIETALRWLIAVVLITLTFGLVDAPESIAEWHDVRSRLTAGAVYFGLLAAAEATGLYRALRRIGATTPGEG